MSHVLITGSNRGIGLEFVRQYAARGWTVTATCRDPDKAVDLNDTTRTGNVKVVALDVSDFSAIGSLADHLSEQPIDVLINNAGIFGPKVYAEDDPRQTLGNMDYGIWQNVLRINTMAPLKMAESFLPHLLAGQAKKIANLSSTVASLLETGGGIYAYRSSKAALNSVLRALANDLKDQGIAVGIYCPGWVKTDMGGDEATVTPEVSVSGLMSLIDSLNIENTGEFRRYNGDVIPW